MTNALPASPLGLVRIVSGGQTGVDRAALDAAIANNIPHGGWCPKGRLAEDGEIPHQYHLLEVESENYAIRTMKNVDDSDGTLVLYKHRLQGGTALTCRYAKDRNKPLLRLNLNQGASVAAIQDWIRMHRIRVLNVAGPRASSDPAIYNQSLELLRRLLESPQLALDFADEVSSGTSNHHATQSNEPTSQPNSTLAD